MNELRIYNPVRQAEVHDSEGPLYGPGCPNSLSYPRMCCIHLASEVAADHRPLGSFLSGTDCCARGRGAIRAHHDSPVSSNA